MAMKLLIATLSAILAAAAASAQQPNPNPDPGQGAGTITSKGTLLFTTTGPGSDGTLSGAGQLLGHLERRDIGVVTPAAGASAETYLANSNYIVMHGDKDGDGNYVDPLIGLAIDAITVCSDDTDPLFPRFQDIYISVKEQIGDAAHTDVMTPGDIASPRLSGGYAYLIRETQIRDAFDIPATEPVDVDAFEKSGDGTLWLSLEDDVLIRGGAEVAQDGDLLMIDASDLTYDGCEVVDVVPDSGTIAVFENDWDDMVKASGVADSSGAAVGIIGDLDALAIDDAADTWSHEGLDGVQDLPHFLFSGDFLDGAAVLTTQLGGHIAEINGQLLALAAPAATDGTQMGLVPDSAATVRPLGSLCLVPQESLRVIADAGPLQPVAGNPIRLEWGGMDPGALSVLAVNVGVSIVYGEVPGTTTTHPGFGYLFVGGLSTGYSPVVAADAYGMHAFMPLCPAGIPAGINMVVQPLTYKAGVAGLVFGAPTLLQF
jgi:hypothetical protein